MVEWIMTDVALWLGRMILVGSAVILTGAGVVLAGARFDWWLACKDQQARELDQALSSKSRPFSDLGLKVTKVADPIDEELEFWRELGIEAGVPVPPEALDPKDREAFDV